MSIAQRPPGVGTGSPGPSGNFHYVASASDALGTNFNYPVSTAAGQNYIAFLSSAIEIPAPAVGDFAGKWNKYVGIDGADGATIIYGTVDPDNGLGNDGDTYIKTVGGVPSVIFGKKASGVWPAGVSMIGANGTNGNTILYGTTDPANSLGNDGDTYIKLIADVPSVIFGKKAGGVWPAGVSMLGADGAPGAQGQKAGLAQTFYNGTGPAEPSAGHFKLDSSNIDAMSILRVSDVNANSVDIQVLWRSVTTGDLITIVSSSNSDVTLLILRVTAPAAETTSSFNISVDGISGAIPSNGESCFIQLTPGPQVLPGVQTVASYTSLPDPATVPNETYLVLDSGLHYTSTGVKWRPQNRKFLYSKITAVVKYVAPAATLGTCTPSTAGTLGSQTQVVGAGAHGLTAAIAEDRKICVKTGNGTVLANSLHEVADVDLATNTIILNTAFASFGSGTVTFFAANEDAPLRTVDIHPLVDTSSLEIISSWGITAGTNNKTGKVVLTDGTNSLEAANPSTTSGTAAGMKFSTIINNLENVAVQGLTIVSTNSSGSGTGSAYPVLNGNINTAIATQIIYKARPAVANEFMDLIFTQIEMSA